LRCNRAFLPPADTPVPPDPARAARNPVSHRTTASLCAGPSTPHPSSDFPPATEHGSPLIPVLPPPRKMSAPSPVAAQKTPSPSPPSRTPLLRPPITTGSSTTHLLAPHSFSLRFAP